MWILIRTIDHAFDSGPFADAPAATATLMPIECPIGYPETMAWSAAANGFVPIVRVLYTFNQWVDLFPLAEQVAIVGATMTDPFARLIYDRAQSASGSIDPTDPRTKAGLQYLVTKGWVSQATFDAVTGA